MPLDDNVRDRVILLAGKVAGVDCPNCGFRSCDVEPDAVEFTNTTCPECDATILTEEQKLQLQQAGKL